MIKPVQAMEQIALGTAVGSVPLWHSYVSSISDVAGMIAAVAGAIIAVHGLVKLVAHYWRKWVKGE